MGTAHIAREIANSARLCREARMRPRLLPWVGRWAGFIGLLFLLHLPCSAAGREFVAADPNKVKAAFLCNFVRYVTWPADVFANVRSPWRICILGSDPFGEVLEETFQDRTEQGRSFEIFRAKTLDKLPPCQIVFVAYPDVARRRAALIGLKNRPVLTVADAPEFLQEGGIIRFQVSDRVEISVNLDQARSVSLKIQTKMLEVSHEVVENGTIRSLR